MERLCLENIACVHGAFVPASDCSSLDPDLLFKFSFEENGQLNGDIRPESMQK